MAVFDELDGQDDEELSATWYEYDSDGHLVKSFIGNGSPTPTPLTLSERGYIENPSVGEGTPTPT